VYLGQNRTLNDASLVVPGAMLDGVRLRKTAA
jgi:hypothetical protein